MFVDISDEHYTPADHGGVEFEAAMGRIHAVLPDDTTLQNVAVFRQVYEILGMGWVYAFTKVPIFGFLAEVLYNVWASWRLALTGRPDLATIVAHRQQRITCQEPDRCQRSNDVKSTT